MPDLTPTLTPPSERRWVADVNALLEPVGFSHIIAGHIDTYDAKGALPLLVCGFPAIQMNWTAHPRPPTLRICKRCERVYQAFREMWMTDQQTHEATFQCGGCDIIKTIFRDQSVRWGVAPHEKDGKGHVIVGVAQKVGGKLAGPYNTTKVSQRWRRAVDAWIEFCNSGRV